MAGELSADAQRYPALYEEVTFGPLAAADFGSTNNYVRLPFLNREDVVVDRVDIKATTRSSVDAVLFALAKVADAVAAPTGALAAANRVTADQNIGDVSGLTNVTMQNVGITDASVHNNILTAGSSLFAFTDVAATALAGLYITMRYRTRRVNNG